MKLIEKAQLVAERVHFGQFYDIYPYSKHLRDVANVLDETLPNFFPNKELYLAAGFLHDSLEDSHLSYSGLKNHFGLKVAEMVFACTDELGRNRKERKAKTYPKLLKDHDAIIIKLADRIANVEHSKEMGNSQFEMYRKEHAEFRKILYIPNIEIHQKLWDRLDDLFK